MWLPPSCFGAVLLMFIFSSIRVLLDKSVEINVQCFVLSVLIYTFCKMWIVYRKTFQNSMLVNIVTNNYSCTFLDKSLFFVFTC